MILFRFLMVTLLAMMGCSEPDDDDMQPLIDAIDESPQGAGTIKMHKDRARLIDRLSDYADDHPVGGISCEEHDPNRYSVVRLRLRDIRKAFSADPGATLVSIMVDWLRPGSEYHNRLMSLNRGLPCTPRLIWYRTIANATTPEERGETTDSAYWLVEQSAAYLRERPELMAAIGLSVVGGVIVGGLVGGAAGAAIGMALCPLSDGVACPGDVGIGDR